MAEVDKDLIRGQVAGLLERADEPQVFDEGLHDLLRSLAGRWRAVFHPRNGRRLRRARPRPAHHRR
jgi:hypothetical protein